MNNPLLSIAIPTRNRQKYCIAAIEDILSYDYPAMELCIQDNSDDDQIEQYIASRKPDSRLVYKRVPDRLNSVHNMDQVVGMTTGKYITMIGDDDTILPEIFNMVALAEENDIDSISSTQTVAYYWPGAYPGTDSGFMRIITPSNTESNQDRLAEKLDALFKKGITRFLDYKLPKLYHGLIRRDRVQQIKEKTGYYFGGLSPDIYSTIALCFVVKNHVVIEKAITVAGACNYSSTSENINKGHRGELSEAPHLILRGPYVWDNYVPAFYSVETIWSESALKAVREMGMDQLLSKYDFSYLVAFTALNNRNIFRFAMKKSLSKDNYFMANGCCMRFKIAIAFIRVVFDRLSRIVLRRSGTIVISEYRDLPSIEQAVRKINNGY